MTRCIVCRTRQADAPSRVCGQCRKATADNIAYLPIAAMRLQECLEPGAASSSGIGAGQHIHSRPPLSIPVLSMLGNDQPNTHITGHRDDQIGGPSIAAILGAWQRTWWELEQKGPRPPVPVVNIRSAAHWLIGHHQWAVTSLEPYAEFAYEIGRTARMCLMLLDHETDRTIRLPGRCPVPDMETDGTPCGAVLKVRPDDESITCPDCGGTWPRHQWPMLGRLMAKAS